MQESMEKEPETPIAGRKEATIDGEIVTYTSLRDVLPPSMAAEEESVGGDRRIISGGGASIRNPLVMQAALAYLQPMRVGVGDRRIFGGHQCGCVGCLNAVVLAVFRMVFGKRKRGADDDDDEDDFMMVD